jgi:hypothetical protein
MSLPKASCVCRGCRTTLLTLQFIVVRRIMPIVDIGNIHQMPAISLPIRTGKLGRCRQGQCVVDDDASVMTSGMARTGPNCMLIHLTVSESVTLAIYRHKDNIHISSITLQTLFMSSPAAVSIADIQSANVVADCGVTAPYQRVAGQRAHAQLATSNLQ